MHRMRWTLVLVLIWWATAATNCKTPGGSCDGPRVSGSHITVTNTQACGGSDNDGGGGATVTTPAPVVVPPVIVPPVITEGGSPAAALRRRDG